MDTHKNKSNKKKSNSRNGDTWIYLITNREPAVKTHSFIGTSRNPLEKLRLHLTGKITQTRVAAAHWNLELVLGPFDSDKANTLAITWREKSRGIHSRRNKGYELAKIENKAQKTVTLYDKNVRQNTSPDNFGNTDIRR